MPPRSLGPLTPAESRSRRRRVLRLARAVGFVGRVEYRHVYSQTGGAQYGHGTGETGDLLTVFAEGFERDADPDDFSLRAMTAHERGHQLLARHSRLSIQAAGASPEVLAGGTPPDAAVRLVENLWDALGGLL